MSDFAERYDEASEEVLAELKKTLETCTGNLESRSGIFRRSRTCHACTAVRM